MLSDTLAAIKEVLLLTDKVDRLGVSLEKMADEVNDHDKRLVRLETMVEIASLKSSQAKLESD